MKVRGLSAERKNYSENVPMIFKKRRHIVHHSRQETCHSFLFVTAKHHVQDWGEHLGQHVQSLGTITTSVTTSVVVGNRRGRDGRLRFRDFRVNVT